MGSDYDLGIYLKKCWQSLADNHSISITQNGLPALAGFSFDGPYSLQSKTLMIQEMLKRGYLAGPTCYLSTAHSRDLIDSYIIELDAVFELISRVQQDDSFDDFLEGPICHSGFMRLN